MRRTKIVYLGAGSVQFGVSFFKDLFSSNELKGSTLTLVDIDREALERMYQLARVMNEAAESNIKVERTVKRREALPGAEFVVNSIAIERNRLWKQDFLVPKKYGVRHTLGENGGPGGLFFTMRTIPLIMDIIRDMEELCPGAYFLNFSNPESRIILAVARYSNIKPLGLCHGIFDGRKEVARILDTAEEKLDILAAGLNHFQWFLGIRDKETGEDLYPLFREKEQSHDPSFNPLTRKLFNTFGLYPSCSDGHIGEYLPYGWEGGEEGYDFQADEDYRSSLKKEIEEKIAGKKGVEDWLKPSGERAVHVIGGILHNKKTLIESGVVYNNGVITSLPADLAVEVPIMVEANGIHPVFIGDLPVGISSLLYLQAGVQQLSVEAAIKGSRELALQALFADPVVNSTEAAESILKELWELNKGYIRSSL